MSAGGVRQVNLFRDSPNTAWGFRLQGGADLGLPLTIQRVCIGSPSEGELHRGDTITRIGNHDASRMTHQAAQNAIKNAGNHLSMTLIKSGHTPPVYQNSHSPSLHQSYYAAPPMPRTDFSDDHRRFVPPPPQNYPAAMNSDTTFEKEVERHSIVSQPHRTFPLITPSIKTKHDVPTGSYLRHVSDPYARARDASMKARVQESILNAGAAFSAGSSPARSSTPEVLGTIGPNTNIVHRQYNSPLSLYSHQNVLDTIAGQTGVTPDLGDLIKGAILEITQCEDPSARKGGPGDIRFFDITKSPTYQAIYEEEWKGLRSKDMAEHKPVQNRVKIVQPQPTAPQHHHHHHFNDGVNDYGVPKDKILQSKSFDMLKNTLVTGQTDF